MTAPLRAELLRALLEIRQAAEKLKSYEPELVDELQAAVRVHLATIGLGDGVAGEARAQCQRIVAQGRAVIDCIERAHQYPAQIMARADVLDRTGMLAKMIRDFLARFEPKPR
jgi:hypothetical protein